MASHKDFVDYAVQQLEEAGTIRARKMFGEYGLYCDGLFFALICSDSLFLKPTPEAHAAFPHLPHSPPYPGARDYIGPVDVDDRESLTILTRITCQALSSISPRKGAPPHGL